MVYKMSGVVPLITPMPLYDNILGQNGWRALRPVGQAMWLHAPSDTSLVIISGNVEGSFCQSLSSLLLVPIC